MVFPEAQINALTSKVIGCAIEVHRHLGPGLLEAVYQECLEFELRSSQLAFQSAVRLPITYKGHRVRTRFQPDLLIEQLLIVEIKCVTEIVAVHEAQLLGYLKLSGAPVGLLVNFNVPILRAGIRRRLNKDHQLIK